MSDIDKLIDTLSADSAVVKPMTAPAALCARLGAVLTAYALVVVLAQGIRVDFVLQLARPFFVLEIVLLLTIAVTALRAAVLLAYPDGYQHPKAHYWPLAAAGLLVTMLTAHGLAPPDARMIIPQGSAHAMECALCIGATAIIPAALLFLALKKGASTHPLQAGAYAVLAAASIGCLTLRMTEANDSLAHLAMWHYAPTVLFAVLGAALGKALLRW